MRTAKVREHWASGIVAAWLKTGKKGKLQVKHSSVLAAAAGAGALPGLRVAKSQGLTWLHTGVMGAKKLGFLGDSCLGLQGKTAS